MLALFLAFIGLTIRVAGDILEFMPENKIDAAKRIEESGFMILVSLTFYVGSQFTIYLAGEFYHFLSFFYIVYVVVAVFIAFQVAASGIKIKKMKNTQKDPALENTEQLEGTNDHASMAN